MRLVHDKIKNYYKTITKTKYRTVKNSKNISKDALKLPINKIL